MGSCCGNDAPTPPNPLATAAATTSTNVNTAVANAYLNNVNQNTPYGSLNYNQTGSYGWTDPTTQQTYQIPTFTSTQTLSPTGQQIQAQNEGAQFKLAGLANDSAGRLSSLLSNNVDLANAPAAGNANNLNFGNPTFGYQGGGPIQNSLGNYGQQQTQFGASGPITNTYGSGDNFSADRQRYEDAMMQRMNPQLAIERGNLEQRLNDQGIRYGSQAYTSAMDDYNRQSNDARFAAVAAGGQEQQRMNQMQAQLAAFQNAAQQQGYQQQLGRGTFANEAQQQMYQQALGAGAFGNQAQAQQYSQNAQAAQFYNQSLAQQMANSQAQFNASNAARNQYLNEQYANRNQPINEVTALLSQSQVHQPSFLGASNNQIPTTDIAGIINTGYNQQATAAQNQAQNYSQLIGGVLGLGAGALKLSDEREKKNIKRVGTVLATKGDDDRPPMGSVIGDKEKLPIYEYSYKQDPAQRRHVGPMAQDVEAVDKRAVKNVGGRKFIDMHRMGSILRAA